MRSFLFGFTMIWIVVLLTNEADRYASKAMPTDFFAVVFTGLAGVALGQQDLKSAPITKLLDRNSNGLLDSQEIESAPRFLKQLDPDRDGSIFTERSGFRQWKGKRQIWWTTWKKRRQSLRRLSKSAASE